MAENVDYPFPMVDIEEENEEEKKEEEKGLLNRLQGRWVQIANGTKKKLYVRMTISVAYLDEMRGNARHSNIMLHYACISPYFRSEIRYKYKSITCGGCWRCWWNGMENKLILLRMLIINFILKCQMFLTKARNQLCL